MEQGREIKNSLDKLLADTYVTLMRTQEAHWNVEGANFYSIHKMTQEQYEEMQAAVDIIAEHIRALGFKAPSGMNQYQLLSSIEQDVKRNITIRDYLNYLIEAHESVKKSLKNCEFAAKEIQDSATEDLVDDRIRAHDKYLWMLKSSLHES